jgi:regulatory protein
VAGTITALKFQQHKKERVSVYLDGEYAFGLPAMEAARLRRGQVLSDAEVVALQALDEQQRTFEQAVRFLGYRPRSRAEMVRYLRRKRITEEVASDVLARLEEAGYLDDEAFARFWVENRQRFRPRSQRALDFELRQKGVSRPTVEDVVSEQDDEAAAWQAIEGRLAKWSGMEPDELRRKIAGYLARRGFRYETISHTFRRACRALQIED